MNHTLSSEDKSKLDRRISEVEKRTESQIVLAVIERSDSYAELPWKAFALGVSLAGLFVLAMNLLSPLVSPTRSALLAMVMMLTAGTGLALLSIFITDFARLFLNRHRVEAEAMQYAESLFLSRELFSTPGRRAVLVMISLFERHIVILPDTGLVQQMNKQKAEEIIRHMSPLLQSGRLAEALENGLQMMESLMTPDRPPTSPGKELPNIIEEKGA